MATKELVPDQAALKRVGEHVRKHLTKNPNAQKLLTDKAEVYGVSYFMNPQECQRTMMMIDATAEPSKAYEVDYSSGFRTSYSGNLDPHDPFVRALAERIDAVLGLKNMMGESIQGQRYMPGQQFKPHQDYFHTTQGYWKEERKRGGQRSWTAMAFLNPVKQGGATHFPKLDISITPQPGVLMVWNNADPEGVPNPDTMHAGTPVIEGVKYVITRWYRTRKWA